MLVEATVSERSCFAGATVATAPWPSGTFALSIDRHSHLLMPRSDSDLQPGDIVAAVTPAEAEAELRRGLSGTSTHK